MKRTAIDTIIAGAVGFACLATPTGAAVAAAAKAGPAVVTTATHAAGKTDKKDADRSRHAAAQQQRADQLAERLDAQAAAGAAALAAGTADAARALTEAAAALTGAKVVTTKAVTEDRAQAVADGDVVRGTRTVPVEVEPEATRLDTSRATDPAAAAKLAKHVEKAQQAVASGDTAAHDTVAAAEKAVVDAAVDQARKAAKGASKDKAVVAKAPAKKVAKLAAELDRAADAVAATAEQARQPDAATDVAEVVAAAAKVEAAAADVDEAADAERTRLAEIAAKKEAARKAAQMTSLDRYGNGRAPAAALCATSFDGSVRLRCDAAEALDLMNTAFRARFGTDLDVKSSYRTIGQQVATKATRGAFAAAPGTSEHGRGRAVDLAGGVGTFGTAQHRWVVENGPTYGWHHPSWAQADGSKPEAWHFEFVADPAHDVTA